MNTNQAAALTADMFDTFRDHVDYLGYGYIGERAMAIEEGTDVTAADQFALGIAAEKGWGVEELFTWANSKNGRWFADDAFGMDRLSASLVR